MCGRCLVNNTHLCRCSELYILLLCPIKLVDPNEIENLSVVKSTSASDMGLESEILKA